MLQEFDEIFPLEHQQVVAAAVIVAGKQDLLICCNGVLRMRCVCVGDFNICSIKSNLKAEQVLHGFSRR